MKLIFLFLFINVGFTTMAQVKILDDLRWKNRIILVNTTDEISRFDDQIANLAKNEKGVKERKIVILKSTDYKLSRSIVNELNKADFILIGLDGGVKGNSLTPYKADELFGIIDGMPMRRNEINVPRG